MEGQTPDNLGEQPKQEGSISNQGISPEILTALGISAEDLESHSNNKREEFLRVARENGKEFYNTVDTNVTAPIRIDFITTEQAQAIYGENSYSDGLTVEARSKQFLPDFILRAYKKREEEMERSFQNTENAKRGEKYEENEYYRGNVRSFLEGFGSGALEAGDWETVISTFDITTPGGIVQNEEAITKMRELPIENKIKIVTQIQKRADDRSRFPNNSSPVGALAPVAPNAAA